jgi:Uma2 family endonuclease
LAEVKYFLRELMMSTTARTMTADELLCKPPKERCELVRGELRMMSPANSRHGWVVVNVTVPLASFVRERRLGLVLGAETGFVIGRDPDTVRAPDVSFVRAERIEGELPEKFFAGAPDLAVEVLSPSDSASEVHEKAEDWLRAGCCEVWLVDTRRKTASTCTLSGKSVVRQPVDVLTSDLLPGFELPVARLFE